MKFPQTTALEIADNIKEIGKNACLAMCYIYCAGIDPDNEIEYIRIVNNAIKAGIISKDCTVKSAEQFLQWLTGRKTTVVKKSVFDYAHLKEPTPVRFKADGYSGHWVVVKDGKIVFNSLVNSINVTKGKPAEARIIKWGIKI